MLEISPYKPEMAGGVLPLFAGFRNRRVTEAMWRTLLGYRPPRASREYPSGLVVLDGTTPVGFLGTLYSERELGGRKRVLCNLSSWIVRDEHKGAGLGLLLRALDAEGVTFTNLTASKPVAAILDRLGFETLDDTTYFVTAARGLRGPRAELVDDPEVLARELQGRDLIHFQDHRYPRCRHLLVRDDRGGSCYSLYTPRVMKKVVPYAHFHHHSDPRVFARCAGRVSARLAARGLPAFVVESRFFEAEDFRGFGTLALKHPRLYRSDGLAPAAVDHLYTEFPVLGI